MLLRKTSPQRCGPRGAPPARPSEAGRAASWLLLLLVLLCAPLLWFVFDGGDPYERTEGALEAELSTGHTPPRPPEAAPQVQRETTRRDERRDPRELELDPELEIESDAEFPTGLFGRVATMAGTPVAGALCEIFPVGETRRIGVARADAEGEFRVRGLALDDPDPVTLRISHPEHAPTLIDDIELAPGVLVPMGTLVLYPPATLSGVCIEENSGRPVGGALLTPLLAFEGAEFALEASAVRSDAQGGFRMGGLAGGIVRLHARAPGYATRFLEELALSGGETRPNYRLRLRAAAPLGGRVEDAAGRGIAGIAVHYEPRPSPSFDLERETVITDAEGRFRLLTADGERGAWVAVTDPRFLPATHQSASYEARDIVLRLERSARLRVLIEGCIGAEPAVLLESCLRSDQQPAPRLFRPVSPELAGFLRVPGGFESAALDPRHWYRVSARCGERLAAQSAPLELDPRREEPLIVRLALTAEPSLRLRVVDGAGGPVAGAFVRVTRAGDTLALRSDADGRVTIGAAGGGDFEVDVEKQGYAPLLDEVLQVPVSGLEQDLVLPRGGRIFGRVTIGGSAPPKPLQVWLRSSADFDLQRRTTTGADGSYAFDGLPQEESYELYPLQGARSNTFSAQRFSHPIEDDDRFAFDEAYEFSVDLEEGEFEKRFDIDLPRVALARLRGVVRDGAGPRSGLAVIAAHFDSGAEISALTDRDGRFALEIMGSGDVDLEVRARSGEELLWVDRLELEEGAQQELDILLRTTRLEVIVSDETATPVPGAHIRAKLQGAAGGGKHAPIGVVRRADADATGSATFEDLAEGRYDVEASAAGFALGLVRQRELLAGVEVEKVELRLARAAIAELALLDAQGAPLAQPVNLEIFDALGSPVPFRDGGLRTAVRGGSQRLDHLGPGGYRFVLSRAGTRLERYADLLGGAVPQRIEWRLELGGAGGESPAGESSEKGR